MIKTHDGKDAKKSQPIAMYESDRDYIADRTREIEKREKRNNVSMSEYIERLIIFDKLKPKAMQEIEDQIIEEIKKRRARR